VLLHAIAFAGVEDVGKDTAVRLFVREWVRRGHAVPTIRTIANRLRRACDEIGLPETLTRELKNYASPELRNNRGRDMLGALGRVVSDMLGPTYLLEQEVAAHEDDHPDGRRLLVVTDARRPEEVKHLRDRGAYVVWVHRPGRGADLLATAETEALCDGVLYNGGDLQHLGILVGALASTFARREFVRGEP
jgi:hypothetical protein